MGAGLGRVVIIDLGGKYKSLHAHLHDVSVSVGNQVTVSTVIGHSGSSGYGRDGYWGPHLHQALFYNATLSSQGGTYGGQSAQPIQVYHYGNGAGYYNGISYHQLLSW
jgi:murein DD-endopeptidase MepM/ murein hydrolase activator NlpD